MSDGEVIECRPTRWFYLRAVAMVAMFAIFLGLFLKDWKVGWPKKNEVYYTFKAFQKAEEAFQEHEEAEGSPEAWNDFAANQKIGFPEEEGLLPAGVDSQATWPKELTDYETYKAAYEAEGNKATPPLWASYTDARGWSSGTPEKAYDKGKIDEQLYFGIGSGVLMLIGLFFLVRTSRRTMKVDGEAYYAPDGRRIPFADLRRIDKRKWETKGLAYLYYEAGGALKKAKVDGMVYGQFKAEEGAPAEQLFQRIRSHFTGELVELESDEDEENDESSEGAGPTEGRGKEAAQGEAVDHPARKEKQD